MQADRADWEMFRGFASTSSAVAYDSYTIPRLSELPSETKIKKGTKGKGTKGAKGGGDDAAVILGGRALGKRQAAGDDVTADQGSRKNHVKLEGPRPPSSLKQKRALCNALTRYFKRMWSP